MYIYRVYQLADTRILHVLRDLQSSAECYDQQEFRHIQILS
jgi:hypothetical protein